MKITYPTIPCVGRGNKRVSVRRAWLTSFLTVAVSFLVLSVGAPQSDAGESGAFLPTSPVIVSTVPPNGDVNPYGVAFVPDGFNRGLGSLQTGDILVSNFNSSNGFQGTGTTIVRIPANGGPVTTFFTATPSAPGAIGDGLSTALAVLRKGFVIVGSVPSSDGTTGTSGPGGLLVINNAGQLVNTITDSTINGPWDMTVQDNGDHVIAFVSNVFAGTVVRLDLSVGSNSVTLAKKTVIASGYQNRPDPVAFVVGPTGLVYRADEDELFVASTEDNAVYMIQQAAKATKSGGNGKVIYRDNAHLHGPLGMAEAPNGNLLVANSDVINGDPNQPSEIVEFTTEGEFVKQLSVDPAQGGSFGLAVRVKDKTAIFAAVNDNTASLDIWTLPISEE
jgi:hypothetical protein